MIYSHPWGLCLSTFYSSLTSHKCSQYLLDQFHFLSQTHFFIQTCRMMHKPIPDDLPHNWISWILLFPLNISQIALRPSEPNSFSVDKNIKETPHLFQSSNIYSLPRQSFVSAVFFFNESHIAFTTSKLNLFSVYHFLTFLLFGCEIHFFL